MRHGLKTILDLEPGLQVVGEASNGEAGLRLALALWQDVLSMDVQLPNLSGVKTTAVICAAWPQAKVMVMVCVTGPLLVTHAPAWSYAPAFL